MPTAPICHHEHDDRPSVRTKTKQVDRLFWLCRERVNRGQIVGEQAWSEVRDEMELARRDLINAARREMVSSKHPVDDVPVGRHLCQNSTRCLIPRMPRPLTIHKRQQLSSRGSEAQLDEFLPERREQHLVGRIVPSRWFRRSVENIILQ